MRALLLGVMVGAGWATAVPAQSISPLPLPPLFSSSIASDWSSNAFDHDPASSRTWNGEAFWHGAPSDVDKRFVFLRGRIYRSIDTGRLVGHDARDALDRLDALHRFETDRRALDGGALTPGDQHMVRDRIDALGRAVWERQRHD